MGTGIKRVADGLTALRFVLALPMIWAGIVLPPHGSLVPAVWLTLVAWTSDWLDGPIARRARSSRQTWLGEHDLEADLCIVVAQAVVLVSWGIWLPALATILVGLYWAMSCSIRGGGHLALLRRGLWTDRSTLAVKTAPLQLAAFVVHGSFMLAVWSRHAVLGRVLAVWLAATLLASPARSWHRVRSFFVVTARYLGRDSAQSPESDETLDDAEAVVEAQGEPPAG